MATYKALRGLTIRTVDGDASPLIAGDIWYNSSSKKIKGAKLAPGAWASGGNLNTASKIGLGAGTQTAALHASGTPFATIVESYDGSSWTEGPDLNTHNYHGGSCGTQTAAIVMGGNKPGPTTHIVTCEKYDGSSWTEVGDLSTGRWAGATVGANSSAALYTGGQNAPTPVQHVCESWNDTSWTEVGDLNTGRFAFNGCGTTTAGITIGGNVNPPTDAVDKVETWNGTSWTEATAIPAADYSMGSAGLGTSTAAFAMGGTTPGPATGGYLWDGSAWAASAALNTGRPNLRTQAGTSTSAMVAGNDPAANITEEWTGEALAAVTFTSS